MNGRRRLAAPVDHRPGVEALARVVGRTRSVAVGAQSDFRHRGELWQFRVPHPGHHRRHVAVRSGDQIVATATLLPGRGHQAAGRALEELPAKLGSHVARSSVTPFSSSSVLAGFLLRTSQVRSAPVSNWQPLSHRRYHVRGGHRPKAHVLKVRYWKPI